MAGVSDPNAIERIDALIEEFDERANAETDGRLQYFGPGYFSLRAERLRRARAWLMRPPVTWALAFRAWRDGK